MPASKKTPAEGRKKVTASARARISTRRVRKQANTDLNRSYLQSDPTPTDAVSTVHQITHQRKPSSLSDSSDIIISMLNKISESNQALSQRVEAIERGSVVMRAVAVRFLHPRIVTYRAVLKPHRPFTRYMLACRKISISRATPSRHMVSGFNPRLPGEETLSRIGWGSAIDTWEEIRLLQSLLSSQMASYRSWTLLDVCPLFLNQCHNSWDHMRNKLGMLSKVGIHENQGVITLLTLSKHLMKFVGPMRATTPLLGGKGWCTMS